MALNTTGKPDVRDYVLGRGVVYLAELNASGLPIDWRDLGNCPEFTVKIESEKLQHFSSRQGTKTKDLELLLSRDGAFNFALDEISLDNAALFWAATTTSLTNPAVAGVGSMGSPVAITTSVVQGRWYDLLSAYDGTGIPTSFTADSVPKIRRVSGMAMDLVLNTDYEIERKTGRVFIKHDAPNLADGDDISWYSAADASAPATVQVLKALAGSANTRYALKFVGVNPVNSDEPRQWTFFNCDVNADGDLALIGDEIAKIGFSGGIGKSANTNLVSTYGGYLQIVDLPRA